MRRECHAGSIPAASIGSRLSVTGVASGSVSSRNLKTRRPSISSAQASSSRNEPLKTQMPLRTFS